MIIKFSAEQEKYIERIYPDLKGEKLLDNKRQLMNVISRAIINCSVAMKLDGLLKDVIIDTAPVTRECFYISDDYDLVKIYFENIENMREFNQSIIHQIGHVQDVVQRGFDLKAFNELKRANAEFAYILWDVHLDGRLALERYYTYFQEQGMYYEYKMKMRVLAARNKDAVDGLFDSMWTKREYTAEDLKYLFTQFI